MNRYSWARWAENPNGWDFNRGAPGIGLFGDAVEAWLRRQEPSVSVIVAAEHWMVDPDRIVQAVRVHPRMRLAGAKGDWSGLKIEVAA